LTTTPPNSVTKPFADLTEARAYVLRRWEHIILHPDEFSLNKDEDKIAYTSRRGPKFKRWQLKEFAEVDDLVRIGGWPVTKAIEEVRKKYSGDRYPSSYDSYESMYNQFKDGGEIPKRSAALAASIFDADIDDATEQCFRLSFILDVETLYCSQ
jgi:hypothetical protein